MLKGDRAPSVTDLKETLQPPDLEDTLSNQDSQLKDAPPFDTGIGALGSVSVHALPDDNITLLVADLGEQLAETANLLFQGV